MILVKRILARTWRRAGLLSGIVELVVLLKLYGMGSKYSYSSETRRMK
jgi:hypothetical protein